MLTAKGQSIILTRENSHIFFDTPFERCYGLFCSNFMFSIKKRLKVKKNVKMAIFKKQLISLKINSVCQKRLEFKKKNIFFC